MKIKKKARISQCMIVKNEEKNIEQALSWGKAFMWEQIVVDTGSDDRTVELAEAMGAKVFYFPWIDDFAAAKNYALQQASGDWIAFLDADEYVPGDMSDKVQSLLTELLNSPFKFLMCNLMNVDDKGNGFAGLTLCRFFRNSPDICYKGRIHEDLIKKSGPIKPKEMLNVSEEFIILHTGYSQTVMHEKGSGERNRRILFEELEEHPEDPGLMGQIGDSYDVEGNKEEAIRWYEKAVAAIPLPPIERQERESFTFSTLLARLATKETEDRMMKIYDKAIKRLPKDADMDFIAGIYFAIEGDYEKGIYHLEKALQLLEEYGYDFRASRMSSNVGVVWEHLALCYYNRKQLESCVNCCVKLLKLQPYVINALNLLLLAFLADEKRYQEEVLTAADQGTVRPAAAPVQVLAFLGKLYDLNSQKDRQFILKAAMNGKYEGMIQLIKAVSQQN